MNSISIDRLFLQMINEINMGIVRKTYLHVYIMPRKTVCRSRWWRKRLKIIFSSALCLF